MLEKAEFETGSGAPELAVLCRCCGVLCDSTLRERRGGMKGVSSLLQAQIINQTLREEKTVMEDGGEKTNKKTHLIPSILLNLKKSPWDCTNARYVF